MKHHKRVHNRKDRRTGKTFVRKEKSLRTNVIEPCCEDKKRTNKRIERQLARITPDRKWSDHRGCWVPTIPLWFIRKQGRCWNHFDSSKKR